VVLTGRTTIGNGNEFFPFACIGSRSEDLKYRPGSNPLVAIGDQNVFREHVTVNASTDDGGVTKIGNRNNFLSDSHVAHDCVISNDTIIGCGSKLAGHVTVQDFAIVNGMTGVIQFVRLGAHSYIGATNKVTRDIPPYMIAEGNPAVVRGVNVVGLERRGFDPDRVATLRKLLKTLQKMPVVTAHTLEGLDVGELNAHLDWDFVVNFIAETQLGVAAFRRAERLA
jgi:UDP-N-acetylglucosamine acyltransferase